MTVDAVVATFDRPMYRPDEARGMMSVISAQSTARNVPAEAPKSAAPTTATGDRPERGASQDDPDEADDAARVDDRLAADPIREPRARE